VSAPQVDPNDLRRLYTGEFPPEGPYDVDELMTALVEAVRRVRVKYGSVVDRLAEAADLDPGEIMARADAEYAEWAELAGVVAAVTGGTNHLPAAARTCPSCATAWPAGAAHACP
jgi:hypothetical protein